MKLKKLIKRFKFERKKKRVRTSCDVDLDLTFLSQMDHFHLIKSQIQGIYMSRFSLCWRCTQSGTSSDPDVVLLRWAFWVQGDLILIYYWGGLRSTVPTGNSPCSAVL